MSNNLNIYSREDLDYWYTRYAPNILWNFESLILRKLNRNEKTNAFGACLEFPLTTPSELSGTPFSFYADVHNKKIFVPISSIKFIDDLSIAFAWLHENGFTIETVIDYIFCLKYGSARFVAGQIPPPLKALHIPDDALNNKLVDETAQKVLKSIIVWILCHELGHIIYQHPPYDAVSFTQSRQFEAEADSFATDMFKRIGTAPAGMVLLFVIFTSFFMHQGDFYLIEEWHNYLKSSTHPVSPDRLYSIAYELINYPEAFIGAEPNKISAKQIVYNIGHEAKKIVEIISSPPMQDLMNARALAIEISDLFPRKSGEEPIFEKEFSNANFDDSDFSGIYNGYFIHKIANGGIEKLPATFIFYKNKQKVKGRFSFGIGFGSMSGYLKDDNLTISWKWGNAVGKGNLSIINKGGFSGEWGNGNEFIGGGSFQGQKRK